MVLRDTTERPEAVEAGTVKLVGTAYEDVLHETNLLLDDAEHYRSMAEALIRMVMDVLVSALLRLFWQKWLCGRKFTGICS